MKWISLHKPRWLLLAIFAAGCAALSYGQGGTKAGDQLAENLSGAPATVTISGSSLSLEAHVWSNRMPTPESHSTDLRIGATLRAISSTLPGGIAVSRLWAVPSKGEPLEASIVSLRTAQDTIRIAATVPLLEDLTVGVRIIAELTDSTGNHLLIRSAETNIQKVH